MDLQLLKAFDYFEKQGDRHKAVSALAGLYKEDYQNAYPYVVGYRNRLSAELKNGSTDTDLLDYVKYLYTLTGRDYFDDFMLALEYNRPPAQRFWQPRRNQLMPICRALQAMENNELDELFISQPPRTGKSTLINFFTIWVMLRHPEKSNLYSSYSGGVTHTYYEGVLEVLNDPITYRWKEIFPERLIASTNAAECLINIDRRKRYASLTARSIDANLNGSADADGYVIADDLHEGIEEALSPDRLNKKWAKVDNDLITRKKEGAKMIWIGTRWSVADCISRRIDLLQNDPKFRTLKYKIVNVPALNSRDESNFEYKFGVGFTTEYYQQRRASFERHNDMASWLAQYQGKPIEREGTVFAPDDMRFYNGNLPYGVDPDRIFMAVDPAWGGGDFTAAPICFQYGDDIYVHDVIYNNGEKNVTQPLLARAIKKYGVQAVMVEATKTTAAYAEGVSEILKKDNYKANIQRSTKHFTGTGKSQRIFDKAPDIRENMLFRDSGNRSKDYELFMQNVYSFKLQGKNVHDDAPDSLAMAINMVNGGARNTAELVSRRF